MEKFLHSDMAEIAALQEFLKNDWQLFDCRVDGSAHQRVSTDAIAAYYQQSLGLWGGHPESYILAVRDKVPAVTGLAAIVDLLDGAGG